MTLIALAALLTAPQQTMLVIVPPPKIHATVVSYGPEPEPETGNIEPLREVQMRDEAGSVRTYYFVHFPKVIEYPRIGAVCTFEVGTRPISLRNSTTANDQPTVEVIHTWGCK